MIRIPGRLVVRRVKSRNGPFNVADLLTDVGEFKVKDPVLDQFKEGEYQGTFWIAEIYLLPYISFGRSITELRVRLHDLQLDSDAAPVPQDDRDSEPDPIEETPPTRVGRESATPAATDTRRGSPVTPIKVKPRKARGEAASTPAVAEANAVAELFGDDVAALLGSRQPVKLDPTIDDRARFRTQTARLRELGYEFDAKTQTWHPKD
jgi:Protein of unknown function (DUF3275)